MENNGSGINDVFIHDDAATIAGDSIGIENDVEDNSRIKPVKISMKNIMGIKDFEGNDKIKIQYQDRQMLMFLSVRTVLVKLQY